MAWGAGGQYIIVRPDLDLVVVITANSFDKINRYQDFFKSFLEHNIYSAVKSDTPLPADRSAARELRDIARQLEYPKELPRQPMPRTAATISRRRYVLEPNGMGFTSVGLSFDANDKCTWDYSRGGKEVHMRVGLRGNYLINTTDFSIEDDPAARSSPVKDSGRTATHLSSSIIWSAIPPGRFSSWVSFKERSRCISMPWAWMQRSEARPWTSQIASPSSPRPPYPTLAFFPSLTAFSISFRP